MKSPLKVITSLLFIIPLASVAQTTSIPLQGITVTGVAVKHVAADQAVFSLKIETKNADAKTSKSINDDKIKKVISYLISNGISETDIQNNYTSVTEFYDFNLPADSRKKEYSSNVQLGFLLKDLGKYDQVSTGLIELGSLINNVTFGYSGAQKLDQELKKKALDDAREKAAQIAQNLGLLLGAATQVVDEESLHQDRDISLTLRGRNSLNEVVQVNYGSTHPKGDLIFDYTMRLTFATKDNR